MENTEPNNDIKTTPIQKKTIQFNLPNLLYFLGIAGLAIGVGVVIGYYAGARSVRWLPTMLEVFLGICILSLALLLAARICEGSAMKPTQKGLRLRRRVIACIVLLTTGILVRLAIFWTQQPSPLTELTPNQFNEAFALDAENYRQYDTSIGQLIQRLEDYSEKFGDDKTRILNPDEEKTLRGIWIAMYDYAFAMDHIRRFYEDWYRFDPSRVQCSYHHRSFLLTFAAELSLYEKSTRFVKFVTQYPNVVKFLNTPCADGSLKTNSFRDFRQSLNGARDNARVIAGKQFLVWMKNGLNGQKVIKDLGCQWLWDKVELELALINKFDLIERAALTVGSDFDIIKEKAGDIWFAGQKKVATMMGDTRVRRRIGEYLITLVQQEEMDKSLEPGDIMISRKNWHLSNAGLPGFWPHAILYIGAPEKFNTYFDTDAVRGWLNEITGADVTLGEYLEKTYPDKWVQYNLGKGDAPCRVIESVSPGVVLHTLSEAFGDHIAAIRPRLSNLAKAQAIVTAFSHIGKPYDYKFDFATDHALVCTELVWRSYRPANGKKGLDIPLLEVAGIKTLPANEFAKHFATHRGTDQCQFDFVYFIDATESDCKTFVSTEEAFVDSCKRVKWSFALE
jgi:hypothetical protein